MYKVQYSRCYINESTGIRSIYNLIYYGHPICNVDQLTHLLPSDLIIMEKKYKNRHDDQYFNWMLSFRNIRRTNMLSLRNKLFT